MDNNQNPVGALAQFQPTMEQSQANLSLGSDPAYSLNSNRSLPASIPNTSPLPVTPQQTTPPSPLTSPFQEQQSKLDSISAQIQNQLEKGSSAKDVPWFALAGALLSPTRTGAFGESLGNAANVMGQYQAEQKKQELPNLQARFSMLQQDLATKKQNKLLELAPQAFTTDENGNPTLNKDIYNKMLGIDPKVTGDLVSGNIALIKALRPDLKEIPEGGTVIKINANGTVEVLGTGGTKQPEKFKEALSYTGVKPNKDGTYEPEDFSKIQNYIQNAQLSPEAKTAFDTMGLPMDHKLTDGERNTFYKTLKELAEAKSSKTNVSVNTSTAKKLGEVGVEGLLKDLEGSKSKAVASANTMIPSIHNALRAIDSGNVVLGPTAPIAQALLQIGTAMGIKGENTDAVLSNTRALMQSQSQANLAMAQTMQGQGSISDSERLLIARAANGDFTMTSPELRSLLSANEKIARANIRYHNQQASNLPTKDDPTLAQLSKNFIVVEPAEYVSPQEAKAELERRRKAQNGN
jgi:hypothetical protein